MLGSSLAHTHARAHLLLAVLTRPARDVDPDAVIAAVEDGIRKTGYTDFSLLSLSCSDYLALPSVGLELRNRLADKVRSRCCACGLTGHRLTGLLCTEHIAQPSQPARGSVRRKHRAYHGRRALHAEHHLRS